MNDYGDSLRKNPKRYAPRQPQFKSTTSISTSNKEYLKIPEFRVRDSSLIHSTPKLPYLPQIKPLISIKGLRKSVQL